MSDVTDKQQRILEQPTEVKIDLYVRDLNNDLPLGGTEFKLTVDGVEYPINPLICDEKGCTFFRITNYGKWALEQIKALPGYQPITGQIIFDYNQTNGYPECVGDQESDWFDYDSPSKTLTVKNAPIQSQPDQSQPEGGTKMKVATDNSLKELIKLVKSQPSTSSGGVLNVTLNYTIPSYSQVEVETKRKRVYADVPCVNSKVAMNAQITPNDNIENVSLLTYAEPFDGYIRCYFSEQPTESYIIDSVELTPVTSIVKKK